MAFVFIFRNPINISTTYPRIYLFVPSMEGITSHEHMVLGKIESMLPRHNRSTSNRAEEVTAVGLGNEWGSPVRHRVPVNSLAGRLIMIFQTDVSF